MKTPANMEHEAARGDDDREVVTLQFRHDQMNSGVSRHGSLRAGGQLRIEYDPARLVAQCGPGLTNHEVICHLRFRPSDIEPSGALEPQARYAHVKAGMVRPLAFELQIPAATTQVEVWFESRGWSGTTGWDSRHGQNYTFAVAEEGLPIPEQSVMLRPNSQIDAGRIHVVEDAASKEQIAIGAGGSRLHTALVIRAQISQPSIPSAVWADVHVFDAVGDLLQPATIALETNPQSGMDDALRLWDVEVYPGSGGASGMGVWPRPDAHTIQYVLYCQIGDQVFTDGVLHQFEVPADTDVRLTPGGW